MIPTKKLIVLRLKQLLSFDTKYIRAFRHAILIILGIAIFAAAEVVLAQLVITNNILMLIVASGAIGLIIVSIYKPIIAYCIWLFFSPWLKPLFYRSQYSTLSITFDSFMLGILAVVLIFRAFKEKKKLQNISFTEVLFLIYALYITIYTVPVPSYFALSYIPRFMSTFIGTPAVAYFVMKGCLSEKKYIVWAMVAFVITGVLWAVAAFYEHFTGSMAWSILAGEQITLSRLDVGLGRAQGASAGTAVMGLVLLIGMLFTAHFGKFAISSSKRVFSYSLLPLLIFAAYFTYTRNTYIGLTVTIFFMIFLSINNKRIYATAFVLLIAVIVLVGPFLLTNEAFNARISDPTNLYGRIAMNKAAMNMIKHNFWLGTGSVYEHINEYVVDPANHPVSTQSRIFKQFGVPDNEFLFIFAQFGFIGFMLWVSPIVLIVGRFFFIRKKIVTDSKLLSGELLSIIVAYALTIAITGNGTSYTSEPYPLFMLFTLLAIGNKFIYFYRDENKLTSTNDRWNNAAAKT